MRAGRDDERVPTQTTVNRFASVVAFRAFVQPPHEEPSQPRQPDRRFPPARPRLHWKPQIAGDLDGAGHPRCYDEFR